MKVVFVCAEDESLGIGQLSAYLKKHHHEVFLVFDPKQYNRAYLRNKFLASIFSRQEENLKKIIKLKPDLIAFSCVTANYQWALEFSQKIKKKLKKIPIIFGGIHPTLVPKLVIKEKSVDMVCVGEGEEALLELAESIERDEKNTKIKNIWFKRGNKIIKNPLRPLEKNLDKYPPPDKALFYTKLPRSYKENISYLASRGCPFNCSFCGNQQKRKLYQKLGVYVRQKSVNRVVHELAYFKKQFGSKQILFGDDIFAFKKEWLKKFVPLFKKKVGLPFSCFIHPQVFDEEQAKLLKTAGCNYVWFGIQSGSEKIRRRFLNRFETNEDILKTAKICHRTGLPFMVDHIFDIPFEGEEEILEAIKLYNQIRPNIINCYNLLYFPQAKIIDHALRAGILTRRDINNINQGKGIVYQTGVLTKKRQESRDFYRRYALLITSLPLLPATFVEKIRQNPKLIRLFTHLPLFLVPLIKITLELKTGFGFIPLGVLQTEIFFTRQFLVSKIKNLFKS